jgi:hypothetical protein
MREVTEPCRTRFARVLAFGPGEQRGFGCRFLACGLTEVPL